MVNRRVSKRTKTAFVLSGGANYGALQVGALDALISHGIHPDMLVGVSAGALNAAFLAPDPSLTRVEQLQDVWCSSAPHFFPPPSSLEMLIRLSWGRDSLLRNDSLQDFIRNWVPDLATFGDFTQPSLFVTAARFSDGTLRVFGDSPDESLFDALMASTALPPLFPPWEVNGELYVDGGVASDLPLQVAVDRGAWEIFALQITNPPGSENRDPPRGVLAIGSQVLSSILEHNAESEVCSIENHPTIRLHLIRLWAQNDPGFWDFTHAEELIADGRWLADRYLATALHAETSTGIYPFFDHSSRVTLPALWDKIQGVFQQTGERSNNGRSTPVPSHKL